MKKYSIKKGFTIIELITVMSIILVLMGLLIPKLNGYRGKAQKLKVDNYARQIYMAAMASYADNGGKFIKGSIQGDINNLISFSDGENDNIITVSTAKDDEATITFTIEGTKHEMTINKDGYNLSNEKFTENNSEQNI
ncbi:type II secretion system protein [Clostridium lundense]|uniref:type II secretion system protein n=1 Tax=Clostridium lundense TaxID=319475 RepID=UPI0006885FEC|nr:type II secretion system protein [Clostridium lundense]